MTLDEAIAEVKRVTRVDDECGQGSMWTGDDFTCAQPEHDPATIDHAIATILNAVASGDLIPRTDAEQADRSEAPERIWVQWPQPNGTGLAFKCQSQSALRHEYTLSTESQRILSAARTAPQWDTTHDRLAHDVSAARIADLAAKLDEAQALIYAARQERNAAEDAEKELTSLRKAHEKEIAVWSENYAALERQLAEARAALSAYEGEK